MSLSDYPVHNYSVTNCRVCLKPGDIPIFSSMNISEYIIIFGGIQIEVQDDFPKYICHHCNTMLQSAILFRETAKVSDRILRHQEVFENGGLKIEDTDTHVDEKSNDRRNFKILFEEDKNEIEYAESDIDEKFYRTESESEEDNTILNVDPDYITDEDMNEKEPYIPCQYLEYEELTSNELEEEKSKDTTYDDTTYDDSCSEFTEVETKRPNKKCRNNKDDMIGLSNKTNVGTNVNSPLECNVCNEIFMSSEDLEEHHMVQHDFRTNVKCDVCGDIVDKSLYQTHLQHHRDKYKQKWQRKYHKIECKICGTSVSKSYYNVHLRKHGTEAEKAKTRRTCPFCSNSYDVGYLAYHIKHIHEKSNKKNRVKCDEKQSKGPEKQLFKRCPVCDRNINGQKFKDHLAMHGKSPKQYVCEQCGKVSIHPSAFKLHCMTHGAELKHKCQFCPYRALHAGLLKVHVRTHTKDYLYQCTECPARFITKSNLTMHQRRHGKTDDFKCDVCNKTFFSKRNLNQHNNTIHLGIRNVKCNLCGKTFGNRNGMLSHQKKVHKTKNITDRVGRMPSYLMRELEDTEADK